MSLVNPVTNTLRTITIYHLFANVTIFLTLEEKKLVSQQTNEFINSEEMEILQPLIKTKFRANILEQIWYW